MSKLIFILICAIALMPVASANDVVLYSYDSFQSSKIPTEIWQARALYPETWNSTLAYNNSLQCIDFIQSNASQTGSLFLSGFYPATDCNYTFDIGVESSGQSSDSVIKSNHLTLQARHMNSGVIRIKGAWEADNKSIQLPYFDIPVEAQKNGRVRINISSNESSRTNTIWFNDTLKIISPYYSIEARQCPYTFVINPTLRIDTDMGSDSYHILHLYGVTQSIPDKTVTVTGSKSITSFGLDYPRPSVHNGVNLMLSKGWKGTVWADVNYLSDPTLSFTKYMLDNGWELGIHFSKSLDDLNYSEACSKIDEETEVVHGVFGTYPTSWCSFRNGDNYSHADYAYKKHGMIWRNGPQGGGSIPTITNLDIYTWNWWNAASSASAVYPAFTHGTDNDTINSSSFDIPYQNFTTWTNAYYSKNITVVGFKEWYETNANQKEAIVNILESDSKHLKFIVKTNGYPANVRISGDLSGSIKVYENETEITFTSGNGLFFETLNNKTYTVTADNINLSKSPSVVSIYLLIIIALIMIGVTMLMMSKRWL